MHPSSNASVVQTIYYDDHWNLQIEDFVKTSNSSQRTISLLRSWFHPISQYFPAIYFHSLPLAFRLLLSCCFTITTWQWSSHLMHFLAALHRRKTLDALQHYCADDCGSCNFVSDGGTVAWQFGYSVD